MKKDIAGFSYTAPVTGLASSYSLTVGNGESLASLGLAFNSASGRLSGTLAKTGIFAMTVTAANSVGKSKPLVLTLTVTDPGQIGRPARRRARHRVHQPRTAEQHLLPKRHRNPDG